jgi:hypothetical protein
MAKSVRLINPSKEELLRREREVLGINLTSIMGENKLKIYTKTLPVKYLYLILEDASKNQIGKTSITVN